MWEVEGSTIERLALLQPLECDWASAFLSLIEEPPPSLMARAKVISDAVSPVPIVLRATIKFRKVIVSHFWIDLPVLVVHGPWGQAIRLIPQRFGMNGCTQW